MMSICSAAATCSTYAQVPLFHAGAKTVNPLQKVVDDSHIFENRLPFYIQDGIKPIDKSFRTYSTKHMHSLVVERPQGSSDTSILSPYPDESDDIVCKFHNEYFDSLTDRNSYSESETYGLYPVGEDLPQPEILPQQPFATSFSGEDLSNLQESLNQSSNELLDVTSSSTMIPSDPTASTAVPVSDTFDVSGKGLSDIKENVEDFITGINQSVDESLDRAQDAIQSTINTIKGSAFEVFESFTKSIDGATRNFLSSVSDSKEQVSSRLKENVYGAGGVAIDVLRRAIISLEDSLGNAASFVVYSYGSAKSLLPPNIKDALNLTEEKASLFVEPVGSTFQKGYAIIEGLERNLGLDPTDPVVQFFLFIGSSAAIGTYYWFFTYGGYSGDLTPEMTFELLKNEKDAILIDVRPEDFREKDGVPDLRRGTRSKYTSVILPEIDNKVRKLLKGGREVEYSLIAAVIRNLKAIKNQSKVIVMDANGVHSKAIARSLKKLGLKNPYVVKGGFQSWMKNGLRIKELKPETALTLLNEEAEAIFEDIKPTPTLVIGSVLGISAATYAILEWEKTLQVIGIIGLGLVSFFSLWMVHTATLYRRVASYENSEDLKRDVRLLLSPVQLGAQAFSWATTKLEPNKLGLPTSPSSSAVRDRVVQAAAKHQSVPSDNEELQGLPQESLVQTPENQVSDA